MGLGSDKHQKRVKQNKGSPGVDGMKVDELAEHLSKQWKEIRAQLLEGTYRPKEVRGVEIPKSGGKVRKLGIPTALDRCIQQCILQVPSPATGATETVETRDDHLPGVDPARHCRKRRPTGGRKLATLVAQLGHDVERRSAEYVFRRRRGPSACALPSTLRTAGCGPACPVVWQGTDGDLPSAPMPIAGALPPA